MVNVYGYPWPSSGHGGVRVTGLCGQLAVVESWSLECQCGDLLLRLSQWPLGGPLLRVAVCWGRCAALRGAHGLWRLGRVWAPARAASTPRATHTVSRWHGRVSSKGWGRGLVEGRRTCRL